jgi:hypothetical protein
MIDPKTVCLFVGPGLKKFKLDLFMRIGHKIEAAGNPQPGGSERIKCCCG